MKQYRIIAQNTAEDMCDWQSKNVLYSLPILTENTKKASI